VTCSIAAGALTVGDHYNFKLKVTDSASVAEKQTSSASAKVTVKSALAVPGTPKVNHTRLVVSQLLAVTGKIPSAGTAPFAWEWLVSINGGAYTVATQCTANSVTGAASGATITCTVSGGTLTVGDTYHFELSVTDSATSPETAVSAASRTVTVVA